MAKDKEGRKPAQHTESVSKDRNSLLMYSMGSRDGRWTPEPIDQWLYVIRHSRCAAERIVAWLKMNTGIARRSGLPFATDTKGRPLTLGDLARDLGWVERTARNEWNELENLHRVKTDKQGRLCLSASVPMAHVQPVQNDATDEEEKDPNVSFSDFVQSHFSGYLADSVMSLPDSRRAEFMGSYLAFVRHEKAAIKEAVAVVRAASEKYENAIFDSFNIDKKRLPKEPPKITVIEPFEVRLPDFVQSQPRTESESTLYKPKTEFVQSENGDASLYLQNVQNVSECSEGGREDPEVVDHPKAAPQKTVSKVTALKTRDHDSEQKQPLYDLIVDLLQEAGKPATLQMRGECAKTFLGWPLALCQRVAEDATNRKAEIWDHERSARWIPNLRDYLNSRVWDTDPVAPRKKPANGFKSKQQELDEMAAELLEKAAMR